VERWQRILERLRASWTASRERVSNALAKRRERRAAAHPAAAASGEGPTTEAVEPEAAEPHGTVIATAEDDVGSVLGRLDAAAETELLLVVPKEARAFRDPMAWPHIATHARRNGLEIRVLAARGDVATHARSAGLRAARNIRGLQDRKAWRVPVGDRDLVLHAPSAGRVLRGSAAVLFMLGVLGGACYFVPSAEVVLEPPTFPARASATLRLNPVADETDLDLGVTPVSTIRRTIVTIVSSATTGSTDVGDIPATASLVFTNQGTADVLVPAGTRVTDDNGVAFLTDTNLTVPPAETLSVGATAELPGIGGNLDADALRLLDGFPETLTVSNPEAAVGGADREVRAIAGEDIDLVRDIAAEVLVQAGRRELAASIEGGFVFPSTVSAAIFSELPLGAVGDPADAFLMEYTAVVTALYLPEADAVRLGEALLAAGLEPGEALLPGTTQVDVVSEGAFDGGQLTVEVVATGLRTTALDPAALREELTGVSPDEASAWLQQELGLETPPTIHVHPDWLPALRMPWRAGRIEITLVGPGQEEDADDEETPDDAAAGATEGEQGDGEDSGP
jgi:hypothetical protein